MLSLIVLNVVILQLCVNSEHIWHSYQHNSLHQSREELLITNVTFDENFKLNLEVIKWKSIRLRNISYAFGLMENQIAVVTFGLNTLQNGFNTNSSVVELNAKPIDASLFEYWNKTIKKTELIAVIATNKLELVWFRVEETNLIPFWTWQINKNISHINTFQIDYNYQILIINAYLTETTADLYEFELTKTQRNFWLRQTIPLNNSAKSSAINYFGGNYFLSIPQKTLFIYKLEDNRFISYKNITSPGLGDVVSFSIGSKSFIAFTGFKGGIYQFTKTNLVRENVVNSNLIGIFYWLPIPINNYRNEIVLLAQRRLVHGQHKSFSIEVITYNGNQFEEHEDIPCNYFGEKVDTLLCLMDEESPNGIVGGIHVSLDSILGLLVPRQSRSSELFMVESIVRKIPSPVENEIRQLLDRKKHLEKLMKSQEEQYKEIKSKLENSVKLDESNIISAPWTVETLAAPALHESNPDNWTISEKLTEPKEINLDSLKKQLEVYGKEISSMKAKFDEIEENESLTHHETIVVNGIIEIEGATEIEDVEAEQISGESASELLNDIARNDGVHQFTSTKTFTDLKVDSLVFNLVNNISANSLLYQGDAIKIDGDLIFEQPLSVEEDIFCDKVNDLKLEDEVISLNQPVDDVSLTFDNIRVEEDGKLNIEQLNNLPMSLKSLIDVRIDDEDQETVENMELDTIYIPHNVTVKNVNGENFDEILHQICLTNINTYIPGHVKILGEIYIDQDSDIDYLNGLNFPQNYLFREQNINPIITGEKHFLGSVTAREVQCSGFINGIDTNQVITLSTEQKIPERTVAENLEIGENFKVHGHVIGEHVNKFLPNPTLSNEKLVKSNIYFTDLIVEGEIILSDNFSKNNFQSLLSDIIYKDEEDVVIQSMKEFPAGFSIHTNLFLNSNTINDIPLPSLVTKNTDQSIQGKTINGDITFGNLHVTGLFNGIDVKQLDQDLVKLSGQQYISSTLEFDEEIVVENLEIVQTLNNLNSNEYLYTEGDRQLKNFVEFDIVNVENLFVVQNFTGEFQDFNLEDFDSQRMSLSKDQVIDGSYAINHSEINEIRPNLINNIDYEELFDYEKFLGKLSNDLQLGKLKIKNLYVNGSIQINDDKMKNLGIFRGSFKALNVTQIEITGDVYFDSIEIVTLSEVSFAEFVENMVFKNETTVNILHAKNFTKGFSVEKLIETKLLNNVSTENILTKQGPQEILSPITIYGDVTFDGNLNITENINEYPVNIKGNLAITDNFNNMKFFEFASNVVQTTKDCDISSLVTFTEPVTIQNQLVLDTSLITGYLDGIDLSNWENDAVLVNKGFLPGNYTFEDVVIKDLLSTEFINEINMSSLIPLRTKQILDKLEFGELMSVQEIAVGNSVNDLRLEEECANTLMNGLDQEISSNLVFTGNVFVQNLALNGFLDNKNISRIVTTNTDQDLTAIYNFNSKITLENNLALYGLVNGINLTNWFLRNMKLSLPYPQSVYDEWVVNGNLVFEENVDGNGSINGLNLWQLKDQVEKKRKYKYSVERNLVDNYINICKDIDYLYAGTKKQIYKFNYFETLQFLDFPNSTQNVHHFKHQNSDYLLISEENNCVAHLLVFNESHFYPLLDFEMGKILQIVTVYLKNSTFLVARNDPSDCVEGTNIWQFKENSFLLIANIETQELLQGSLVPGTFYGMNRFGVTEFKLSGDTEINWKKYRKWEVHHGNVAFVPRGLNTGLALRTGTRLIRLRRDNPTTEDDFGYETEGIIRGETIEEFNNYLPGRIGGDLVVLKVGTNRRPLLAVASHEETSVKGRLDFIKIYEDAINGKVFHKVPTSMPSALISLEFDNGETLLAFIEDQKTLQVYEYKGIEGFKHRISAKLEGSQLFSMTLASNQKILGLVNKNRISIIEAKMLGNQIEDNLQCRL